MHLFDRFRRFLGGAPSDTETTPPPPAQDTKQTVGQVSDLRNGMKEMRAWLRSFGGALGAGATVILAGLGYTQVHKIFPLPADSPDRLFAFAILSSFFALAGAALATGRFFGAQRRVGISTEPEKDKKVDPLRTKHERAIRTKVFTDAAAEEDAFDLRAVELRALRLRRIAQRTLDDERKAALSAEADRLMERVGTGVVSAAARVLEWRSDRAVSGLLTWLAVLMSIVGIIGLFGLADWSDGQRQLVALRKSCADAVKAGAADACNTVVPKGDRTATTTTTNAAAAQKSPWLNSYVQERLPQQLIVYRVYGGDSDRRGPWATGNVIENAGAAIRKLALPKANGAHCIVRVIIPKGMRVRRGHVAPHFGHPGGATQIYVVGRLERLRLSGDTPLPPSKGPCP
jgi:Tuberculosis necrotizing toxin